MEGEKNVIREVEGDSARDITKLIADNNIPFEIKTLTLEWGYFRDVIVEVSNKFKTVLGQILPKHKMKSKGKESYCFYAFYEIENFVPLRGSTEKFRQKNGKFIERTRVEYYSRFPI